MALIKDLEAKQGKIEIEGSIISITNTREFNKQGKIGRVASAIIKDDSGEITLTLWNEEIDKVKAGNVIRIRNGYVNEWQGEKQISAGKFGNITVLK